MPVVSVPSSSEDRELVLAFDENEFDIAGMADLRDDDKALSLALQELHLILISGNEPRRVNRIRLARVLLAMTTVARNDYAGSGHQEYWPFLFDRIEEVVSATARGGQFACLRTQLNQSLLGRWFRFALDEFGYTIPEEGQTYVGPIVFHAGIPRTSLSGAMQLVDTAVRQFAQSAVNLPYDLRTQLARNHFPPLHRNVERLLASQLTGASQLWSSLARAVFAWQQCGDCTEELRQLPAALDPQDVRQALPSRDAAVVARRSRTILPLLRFDVTTGEVRLTFPSGTSDDWKVTGSGSQAVALRWQHTHLGLTSEFLAPPPEDITVFQRGAEGIRRTLVTRPAHWPGIWFHASNGTLEDGKTIDANGLEPGRWFVLFEGTPTRWNVSSAYRVQLKWSWFSGHQDWSAWEIDVPARSPERPQLECFVDDNRFHVPLARRPGARVELCGSPMATALTGENETVEVFAEAPVIRLCRDRSLAITLLRQCPGHVETVHREEMPPERPWRIPVNEAGVYQLRESRGVGRVLLHFAVIPGVKVTGPTYDSKNERVAVEMRGADATGEVCADADQDCCERDGVCRIEQSTVEPALSFKWQWRNGIAEPLTFRWPIAALRWRVLRLAEEAARWTRDTVFVSPKDVERQDAQLEIQVPSRASLKVNEQSWSAETLQRRGANAGLSLSLLPYGEIVSVSVDEGEPTTAVIKSDRPLVDSLEVLCDGESVLVTCTANGTNSGLVLIAWDPRQLAAEPRQFALADNATELSCQELSAEVCSLAIGRIVRHGFRKTLLLAADEADPTRPVSQILDVHTGEARSPNYHSPATWTEFLHCLTVDRLNGTLRDPDEIKKLLSNVGGDCQSMINRYLELDSNLEDSKCLFEAGWRAALRQALTEQLTLAANQNPAELFGSTQGRDVFARLLRLGIPLGQTCPQKWLTTDTVVDHEQCSYPFSYLRDLWLLGTRELSESSSSGVKHDSNAGCTLQERRLSAARRVWSFLKRYDLCFALPLLPMLQNSAYVGATDERHRHSVSFPPRQVRSESEFVDAMGLDTVALDCHATCDDHFWKMPSTNKAGAWHSPEAARAVTQQRRTAASYDYSLLWALDERQWYIERPGASPPTCCRTTTLTVPAVDIHKLLEALGLRQVLAQWSRLDASLKHNGRTLEIPEQFADLLCSEPTSGALHSELLTAPRSEARELLGTKVVVPSKCSLSERARISWQIAWLERLSAWGLVDRLRASDADVVRRALPPLLAEACSTWPELMRRCLALTEFLIWTLYRGGLGMAMRFGSDRSTSPLGAISEPEPEHVVLSQKAPLAGYVGAVPAPKLVSGATGVIIDYDGGSGHVIVKHPTSPSLATTVKAYAEQNPDTHCWIVPFDWKVVEDSDRKKVQAIHESTRTGNSQCGTKMLRDIMQGMTVRCELRKEKSWQVTAMSLVFNGQRFTIPPRRLF